MRGPVPLLLLAGLALTALSGCVGDSGAGQGLTARAAAGQATAEAADWADDAVLVSLFGVEYLPEVMEAETSTETGMASEGSGSGKTVGTVGFAVKASAGFGMANPWGAVMEADDVLGDGKLPAWGAVFVSPAGWKVAFVVVNSTGAHLSQVSAEMEGAAASDSGSWEASGEASSTSSPATGEDARIQRARDNYARWSVDSNAAMRNVRSENATLEAAFDVSAYGSVSYELDFVEEVGWHLGGRLQNATFDATVDIASGEVAELDVGVVVPPPPPLPLPPPIHQEGDTAAGADPFNNVGRPPCSTPAANCVEFDFTVEREVTLDATLTFGSSQSDFDVYIYDDEGSEVASGVQSAGSDEVISVDLEAGTYTVQVVPWTVVNDHWVFDGKFS